MELFIKQMREAVGDEYRLIGEYVNRKTPVYLMHKKCGKTFKCNPSQFLSGSRCIYCGKMFYKSQEYFENEVLQLGEGEYEVLGKYKGSEIKVLMEHKKCGHKYEVKPGNFLSGKRCPKCKESNGEKLITRFLEENQINYRTQYSFKELVHKRRLKFDFAIFIKGELFCLIEFDGPQHFYGVSLYGGEKSLKEQKKRDELKNKFCKEDGYKLIRISYKEINQIDLILNEHLSKLKQLEAV